MTKDQLSYLLEGRPNVAALENLNIFPDTDVAHSLHSKRNVLDRNLRRVSLSNRLARRPSIEDMHTQGYIERPGERARARRSPIHCSHVTRSRRAQLQR